MALLLPRGFKNHVKSKQTSLSPVVRIGSINISTSVIRDYKPILLNIPAAKESIDLESGKYRTSSFTIQVSNMPYNGIRFTDLFESSLINENCDIFWFAKDTQFGYAIGDLNGDGIIDFNSAASFDINTDVGLLLTAVLDNNTEEKYGALAELTGDGGYNQQDAQAIQIAVTDNGGPLPGGYFGWLDDIGATPTAWTLENIPEQPKDAMQIFRGVVRRVEMKGDTLNITAEDRSQTIFGRDLPLANTDFKTNYLAADDSVPENYHNRPIPMCYGFVEKSPCVAKQEQTDLVEGVYQNKYYRIFADNLLNTNNSIDKLWMYNKVYVEVLSDISLAYADNSTVKWNFPERNQYIKENGAFIINNKTHLAKGYGEAIVLNPLHKDCVVVQARLESQSFRLLSSEEGDNHTAYGGYMVNYEASLLGEQTYIGYYGNQTTESGTAPYLYRYGIQFDYGEVPNKSSIIIYKKDANGEPLYWTEGDGGAEQHEVPADHPLIGEKIILNDFTRGFMKPYFYFYWHIYLHYAYLLGGNTDHYFRLKTNPEPTLPYIGGGADYVASENLSTEYIDSESTTYVASTIDATEYSMGNTYSIITESFKNVTLEAQAGGDDFEPASTPLIGWEGEMAWSTLNVDKSVSNCIYIYEDFINSNFYSDVEGRLAYLANGENGLKMGHILNHIVAYELYGSGFTNFLYEEGIINPEIPNFQNSNYANWKYSFTIHEKIPAKKLIEDLCSASPYRARFNHLGEFKISVIPDDGGINVENPLVSANHTIKESDVISFSYSRTKIEKVYSQIELKWGWDYAKKEFTEEPIIYNVEDAALNGDFNIGTGLEVWDFKYYGLKPTHEESTLVIDDAGKFIREEATAIKFAKWKLFWHMNQKLKIKVRLSLSYIGLEVADLIEFETILGKVKPFNIRYDKYATYGDFRFGDKINGQQMFPRFIITSTNKTLEYCEIECMQLPNMQDPYIEIINADAYQGCGNVNAVNYDSNPGCEHNQELCIMPHSTDNLALNNEGLDSELTANWLCDEEQGPCRTCGRPHGYDANIEYTDDSATDPADAVPYNPNADPEVGIDEVVQTLAFENLTDAKNYWHEASDEEKEIYFNYFWYINPEAGCNKFYFLQSEYGQQGEITVQCPGYRWPTDDEIANDPLSLDKCTNLNGPGFHNIMGMHTDWDPWISLFEEEEFNFGLIRGGSTFNPFTEMTEIYMADFCGNETWGCFYTYSIKFDSPQNDIPEVGDLPPNPVSCIATGGVQGWQNTRASRYTAKIGYFEGGQFVQFGFTVHSEDHCPNPFSFCAENDITLRQLILGEEGIDVEEYTIEEFNARFTMLYHEAGAKHGKIVLQTQQTVYLTACPCWSLQSDEDAQMLYLNGDEQYVQIIINEQEPAPTWGYCTFEGDVHEITNWDCDDMGGSFDTGPPNAWPTNLGSISYYDNEGICKTCGQNDIDEDITSVEECCSAKYPDFDQYANHMISENDECNTDPFFLGYDCIQLGFCASGIYDCAGECDGSLVQDICGVCGGTETDETQCTDYEPQCESGEYDCAGICTSEGGDAVEDECGVCGGIGMGGVCGGGPDCSLYNNEEDCMDAGCAVWVLNCDCNGNYTTDECGECGGDGAAHECNDDDETVVCDSADCPGLVMGDLNEDGYWNIQDIILMMNYILGAQGQFPNPATADMNGDGAVDVMDIIQLMNLILEG